MSDTANLPVVVSAGVLASAIVMSCSSLSVFEYISISVIALIASFQASFDSCIWLPAWCCTISFMPTTPIS
jgi:sugar phosphate permease